MLTGVIILLLVLITLLAVPVTLRFQVSWHQTVQGKIHLLWLFGLVRIPIPISHPKSPSNKDEEAAKIFSRRKHSPNNKQNVFSVFQQKPFRRRIFRFIRDLWRAIQKNDLRLRIRIGLGDPADTGQLWAIVGPVSGILANTKEAVFEFEPDFVETTFELDSSGKVRLIPLHLIYLTVGLLLSPPFWQAIKKT